MDGTQTPRPNIATYNFHGPFIYHLYIKFISQTLIGPASYNLDIDNNHTSRIAISVSSTEPSLESNNFIVISYKKVIQKEPSENSWMLVGHDLPPPGLLMTI